ncbi:MAG TPA: DUF1345 domain-containing protein [Trebonia sp.]
MISGGNQRHYFGPVPAGRRVAVAMAAGCVTGAAVFHFTRPVAAVLLGWDTAAAVYLLWVWGAVRHLNAGQARSFAAREALSGSVTDLVVLVAGTASLAAVGLALFGAGRATGGTKAYLIGIGVLSVALSWAVVHTVYTLRYARAYYAPQGAAKGPAIDFNAEDPPTYLDFAYLSFTIGMTFQVSDTSITTRSVRHIALRHALLSYLFGAVILAVAINLVASLLS